MGKRGPRPLPKQIKASRGTLRPCRESQKPPRGEAVLPPAPSGLDSRERREWTEEGGRLLWQAAAPEEAQKLNWTLILPKRDPRICCGCKNVA